MYHIRSLLIELRWRRIQETPSPPFLPSSVSLFQKGEGEREGASLFLEREICANRGICSDLGEMRETERETKKKEQTLANFTIAEESLNRQTDRRTRQLLERRRLLWQQEANAYFRCNISSLPQSGFLQRFFRWSVKRGRKRGRKKEQKRLS